MLIKYLERYAPCDIYMYNADETAIYYCAVPDGFLIFSTDKFSGSKRAKDCVTALVTANMDGTDKYPLLTMWRRW